MDPEVLDLERKAEELAMEGDWGDSAEALNRRLVELAPQRTAGYTRLARCLKERGDTEGARDLYLRVLLIDPTNGIATRNLRPTPVKSPPTRAGRKRTAATVHPNPSAEPGAVESLTSSLSEAARDSSDGATTEGLVSLQGRLERHFTLLHERRNELQGGSPIFALEHDLSDAELAVLKAEVCDAVRRRSLPEDAWLPFVVYAAEIGYEYAAYEYWQTFEARTPNWTENGDRDYVRRKFRQFKDVFGGAEPTGAWAVQFSIICWPITHAVLPTDLQRHLARLLFEYRRALTAELLNDPAELGKRLAARSWNTSSRFKNFAQNTDLLGQVAVALLMGDDDDSPYLLSSTLRRIVADLSKEREAWRLLREAKVSATQVRIRGFVPADRTTSDRARAGSSARLPSAADPELSVRKNGAWAAYLEIPDLSVLADRLPLVHEEAARLRAKVTGVSGPPLPRGQLLYRGRQLRLDDWPDSGPALIQLENGSEAVNSLLADQCVISPGPVWLFRVREAGLAREVRGKFIRPGHTYVVLTLETLPEDQPPWIHTALCSTAGVHAYTIEAPAVLDHEDLTFVQAAGFGAVTDVTIRPAGIVAAGWDGEGAAEWLGGEDPMIAVSSSLAVSRCVVSVDGAPYVVDWPADDAEIFVRLTDLAVGSHSLDVSLIPEEPDQRSTQGAFDLIIRAPAARPSTGSFREGLMIIASPVSPTLTEIWDSRAALDIFGPSQVPVTIEMVFADGSNRVLTRQQVDATLPVERSQWPGVLSRLQEQTAVRRFYDEAESCVIRVSHPSLGAVDLTCEREFSPLRWISGRAGDVPFVRLLNNTEDENIELTRFDFARPDLPVRVDMANGTQIRSPGGGLVLAHGAVETASVVLPPYIRAFSDMGTLTVKAPSGRPRSADEVRRLIGVAALWHRASLPADPFAAIGRLNVERAIARGLASLIGGERWAALEERAFQASEKVDVADLDQGLGKERYHRELAAELTDAIDRMVPIRPEGRAQLFAHILPIRGGVGGAAGTDPRLSEVLLRLASDPASVASIPEPLLESAIEVALSHPLLIRAARFIVLAIHGTDDSDLGSVFDGWAWE